MINEEEFSVNDNIFTVNEDENITLNYGRTIARGKLDQMKEKYHKMFNGSRRDLRTTILDIELKSPIIEDRRIPLLHTEFDIKLILLVYENIIDENIIVNGVISDDYVGRTIRLNVLHVSYSGYPIFIQSERYDYMIAPLTNITMPHLDYKMYGDD